MRGAAGYLRGPDGGDAALALPIGAAVWPGQEEPHGLARCRCPGLRGHALQAVMTFPVVNAKRIMKLLTAITLHRLAEGQHRGVFRPVYDTLPRA